MTQSQMSGVYMIHPFPYGNLLLMRRSQGLTKVKYYPRPLSHDDIMPASRRDILRIEHSPGAFETEMDLLQRYFRGEETNFNRIELDFSSASPFQKKVWSLTRELPYGRTSSYKFLAEEMGHRGYRSIGRALHANPWIIIVPCHRVIRSDGGLGEFAAGLKIKQYLLSLEKSQKN
ncbi:MAG: MGMT family protein [Candidatus Aminicenantes bacterium]